MNRKKIAGITLIEVMVAAAVIVILAAIAYPAYQNQIEKARRSEAREALSKVALAEERFFTVNGRYTNNFSLLDLAGGDFNSVNNTNVISSKGYYDVRVTVANNNTEFTLNAVAVNGQVGDEDCSWYTITQLGVRVAENANQTRCW